ncbi:glycosyltransferase [candidate division KSB1 bacterium]|nr:glycosyltransferase [candidate division KSB1 bacterium]
MKNEQSNKFSNERLITGLVSIIIPSYNQASFIRDTIESCLRQDYRPLEVIIIDGASTDDTIDILHEYDHVPEIRWISEPDTGVAEAVNKGFAMARGEIAAIQSSDDSYLDGAVSQALKYFQENPSIGLVYADVENIDIAGNQISTFHSAPFSIENFLSKSTLILQPAAFFKLEIAKQLGGWNPEYFNCDTEMWLRMIFRVPALKVDQLWARRTLHDGQRNLETWEIIQSNTRMIRESSDIKNSSRRIRRAAKCGIYLTAATYNSANQCLTRFYIWRAFFKYPEIIQQRPKLLGQMIPYYWTINRWFMRATRAPQKLYKILIKSI